MRRRSKSCPRRIHINLRSRKLIGLRKPHPRLRRHLRSQRKRRRRNGLRKAANIQDTNPSNNVADVEVEEAGEEKVGEAARAVEVGEVAKDGVESVVVTEVAEVAKGVHSTGK